MKARKRVVTSTGTPRPAPKRTPTVRRIRSAIVPAPKTPGSLPGTAGRDRAARSPAPSSVTVPPPDAGGAEERPVDLAVDLGRGLVLRNPVVLAAGPAGFGIEHGDAIDLARIGAVCTRSVTIHRRAGNASPRMAEVPAGLLNGVGLQNPGIATVLERYGPAWRTLPAALVVSIAGESTADYVAVVRQLEAVPGVDAVELNLACPNAGRGGLLFGLDVDAAASLTAAVRRATDLPVLVKLSAGAADVRAVARAVEDAGADALTAINTIAGLAVAPGRDRPLLGSGYGGLSGTAIRSVALRVVFEVAQAVDIPVLAAGGITGLDDVLDFLAVGAAAVQVGTAVLADPGLPVRLADGLAAECRRRGLDRYDALIGTALPKRMTPPSARGAEYRP